VQRLPASDYEDLSGKTKNDCDEDIGEMKDKLDNFLDDKQCDKTIDSYHTAYESL